MTKSAALLITTAVLLPAALLAGDDKKAEPIGQISWTSARKATGLDFLAYLKGGRQMLPHAAGETGFTTIEVGVSPEEAFQFIGAAVEERFRSGTTYWSCKVEKPGAAQRTLVSTMDFDGEPVSFSLPEVNDEVLTLFCSVGFDVKRRALTRGEKPGVLGTIFHRAWRPSPPLIEIEGVGTVAPKKVEAIQIKRTFDDLDGDGLPDLDVSDTTFEIPASQAGPFLAWARDIGTGMTKGRRMKMSYGFNDGTPFAIITTTAYLQSLDWADPSNGSGFDPDRAVAITLKHGRTEHQDLTITK